MQRTVRWWEAGGWRRAAVVLALLVAATSVLVGGVDALNLRERERCREWRQVLDAQSQPDAGERLDYVQTCLAR